MHVRAQDCQGRSSQPRSQAAKKSEDALRSFIKRKPDADAVAAARKVTRSSPAGEEQVDGGLAVVSPAPSRLWSLAPLLHSLLCPHPHDQDRANSSEWHPATLCSAWQARKIDREIRRILTRKAYYQAFLGSIG